MKKRKVVAPQQDTQSVNGLLYQIPAAKTDIRRTFWEKCAWVGPEEKRRLEQLQEEAGYANA